MTAEKKRNIISDKLLVEKTGKSMEEWFLLLDKKGAANLDKESIFRLISSVAGLKPLGEWNQNLLTTTYTWSRGLKERGQKEKDFEVSVSKTVEVPVNVLFESLINDKIRDKWLKEKIEFSKTTLNKSARALWKDGKTRLSIDLYPKGDSKSQMVVQHLKIPDAKKAESLKIYWGKTLEALKKLMEK